MEYLTFVEELKKHILKNEKWNISEENYKFYPDGYNAESDIEKEFIRNTNVKYNRVESDTLIGDFLNLTVTLEGRTDTYCRFSVKELYNEYQEYGWERVDFIISENIKLASFYSPDEIMKNITDYEFIRNRLIVRPINFTDNKYELKEAVNNISEYYKASNGDYAVHCQVKENGHPIIVLTITVPDEQQADSMYG